MVRRIRNFISLLFVTVCIIQGLADAAQNAQELPPISLSEVLSTLRSGIIRERTIKSNFILQAMKNGLDVLLLDCVIEGDLDFGSLGPQAQKLSINVSLAIYRSVVQGNIKTSSPSAIEFKKFFGLSASEVHGEVNINADFDQVSIGDNIFHNSFFFSGHVVREAFFQRNIFKDTFFIGGRFERLVDFSGTTFLGPTIIGGTFHSSVNFSKSIEQSITILLVGRQNSETLEIPIRVSPGTPTKFGKTLIFANAVFEEEVNFQDAIFQGKIYTSASSNNEVINAIVFKKLNIRWSQIQGKLDYNEIFYIDLIKNFRDLHRFEDADKAYYEYRVRKRDQASWYLPSSILERLFLDWSTAYGTEPFRAAYFSLGWITFFALLFFMFYRKQSIQRFKLFWLIWLKSMDNFLPGVGLPLGHQVPDFSGERGAGIRLLLTIERLLGWYTMTIFIIALSTKFIRY